MPSITVTTTATPILTASPVGVAVLHNNGATNDIFISFDDADVTPGSGVHSGIPLEPGEKLVIGPGALPRKVYAITESGSSELRYQQT